MSLPRKVVHQCFRYLAKVKLTAFEKGYFESLKEHFKKYGWLSPAQEARLIEFSQKGKKK